MKERNFYFGMGMGLVVGGCAMYALPPTTRPMPMPK